MISLRKPGHRMDNNIKVDLSCIGPGMDSLASGLCLAAVSFDYGNSPTGTIKGEELDHPNDCQLLKKEYHKTILFNIKFRIYCPYL
jgi:hypothetical protein